MESKLDEPDKHGISESQLIEWQKIDINVALPASSIGTPWTPCWEAHKILEGKDDKIGNLYHGAIDSAFDKEGLIEHKITHIVHLENYFKPKFINEFDYLECNFEDLGGKELFFVIEKAVPFIRKGLKKGNVLVHCAAGISRSSSVIIGYLLTDHRDQIKVTNVQECLEFLRTKRSMATPQVGFIRCLNEYHSSNYDLHSEIVKNSIGKTESPAIIVYKRKSKRFLGFFNSHSNDPADDIHVMPDQS
jgi:protein-tyrosine phosphatase